VFKRASNKLQKAYSKGFTTYPRVSNNYINDTNIFLFHPHPPLKVFDEYSKPLKLDEYIVKWETLPLLLENLRISTPATIVRNLDIIEKYYYKDNLVLKEDLKAELEKKFEALDKFIELATKDKLISSENSIDELFADGEIAQQNMPIHTYFFYQNNQNKKLYPMKKIKDRKENFTNREDIKIDFKKNLTFIQDEMDMQFLAMQISDNNVNFDLDLLELEMMASNIFCNSLEVDSNQNDTLFLDINDINIFEKWKLRIKSRYISNNNRINLSDFYIKREREKILFIGYRKNKGINIVDYGDKIDGFGENIKKKAELMIEIARAKRWNLDRIHIQGSEEFKKEVKNILKREKTKIGMDYEQKITY
jgi:hypothetical protein